MASGIAGARAALPWRGLRLGCCSAGTASGIAGAGGALALDLVLMQVIDASSADWFFKFLENFLGIVIDLMLLAKEFI